MKVQLWFLEKHPVLTAMLAAVLTNKLTASLFVLNAWLMSFWWQHDSVLFLVISSIGIVFNIFSLSDETMSARRWLDKVKEELSR